MKSTLSQLGRILDVCAALDINLKGAIGRAGLSETSDTIHIIIKPGVDAERLAIVLEGFARDNGFPEFRHE